MLSGVRLREAVCAILYWISHGGLSVWSVFFFRSADILHEAIIPAGRPVQDTTQVFGT